MKITARLGATLAALLFIGSTAVVQVASSPTADAAVVVQPCSASYIGVPGSGESSTSSGEMSDVANYVAQAAANSGQKLRNSINLPYPAVPWYWFDDFVKGLNTTLLDNSESAGVSNLLEIISGYRAESAAAGCPNAPILLAGYSQGAEVVIRAVHAMPAATQATVSVALLGDPSFIPNVTGDLDFNNTAYKGIRPSFSKGKHDSLPSDVLSRTRDICAASDPICAYHVSELPGLVDGHSAHYHYTSITYEGITLTHYAGNWLWAHQAPASPISTKPAVGSGRVLASPCLNMRTGPGSGDTLVTCIPVNTVIPIDCTASGSSVTGPYGTETTWDQTSYGGQGGYVADAWVYTGTNSPVAGSCSASTPPSSAPTGYETGRQVSVVSQATGGVSGHKGPANSYAAGPTHPANSALWIVCYVNGQSIAGPYGTETAWDLGDDGYYYSDAWIWTGSNSAVVPACSLKNVTVVSQATGGDSGHAGPSNAYAAGPTHPAGATIQIACYVDGQSISGPYGTEAIWDLSTDGYYYADAWLWTDSNGAVVPEC
jgi:uncharacterized protein YraI/predicted esterase